MESSTGEEITEQEEANPCFICHKLIKFNGNHNNNNGDFHRLEKNLEVCQKFCTLAGRFLNFSCGDNSNNNATGNFNQRKTLNNKTDTYTLEQQICVDCFNWAQIFCDIYGTWRTSRLWLIHTVQEMATLMKKKNTENNNDINGNEDYFNKAKVDGFRSKFLLHVEKRFSKGEDYPKLKLKRLPISDNNVEDSDDLFTPVVVKKKRKFKKSIAKPPKDSTVAFTNTNNKDPTTFSSGNSDTETISNSKDTVTATVDEMTETFDQSSNNRPVRYPVRTVAFASKTTVIPSYKPTKRKLSQKYKKLRKVRDSNKIKISTIKSNDNIDNDGDYRLSCKFCGKTFSLSYNRRIHERIHTGERPHKCPVCSHSSKQLGHLQKHLLVTHRLDANKVKALTTRNSSTKTNKKLANKKAKTKIKLRIKIKPSEDENLEQSENETKVDNKCKEIELYTGNENPEPITAITSDLDVIYPVNYCSLVPDSHENEVPEHVGLVFGGKVEIECNNAEADNDDEHRSVNPNANFILPCIDTNFDGYAEEEMEVD